MKNIFDVKPGIFFLFYFILPLIILLSFFFALEFSGADIGFGREFFDDRLVAWPLKNHWLTEKVVYQGGRFFFIATLAVFTLLFLVSLFYKAIKPYRRNILYILVAIVTGPIIISMLNKITHIYCPQDLSIFGGVQPYIRIFDPVPPLLDVGRCFPSTQAGLGYSFVSLYFFLLVTKPQFKIYGLLLGLTIGLLLGVTQQMRGGHFMSHDVMSLLICWFTSLFWFVVFYRKQIRWVK